MKPNSCRSNAHRGLSPSYIVCHGKTTTYLLGRGVRKRPQVYPTARRSRRAQASMARGATQRNSRLLPKW